MKTINKHLNEELNKIKKAGLYKEERSIYSKQDAEIIIDSDIKVLNFCANNYLGLSNHPKLLAAAKDGLDKYGFGLSSVRFICGTQTIHTKLESKISSFLNKQDTILYTSCYDANGGLFETLLDSNDAVISDQLNHASIIDGVRLCKAQRFRYENSNMEQLESLLKKTQNCNHRLITTDGVFSMDGYVANLKIITQLAEKYNAFVHVDDSHATGFLGPHGQGSPDYHNVINKVDIITSTLGKALGGASGGFTSSTKEVISILRQRSRPYLFSNSLSPSIVYASLKAIELIEKNSTLREKLMMNTKYFREKISMMGFNIKRGIHPIIPIMINDAQTAQIFASDMLKHSIYVIAFSYPVVPKNEARIRVQIGANHNTKQLDQALDAFLFYGKKYKII